MLILGHVGITLGAAALVGEVAGRLGSGKKSAILEAATSPGRSTPDSERSSNNGATRFAFFSNIISVKFLILGSLLPDIIDKPLGHLVFRHEISNGRIYTHTLLFLVVIAIAGIYIFRKRAQTWLLALSFGTMMHLVLDQMWQAPRTLLWPLYGFSFARLDLSNFIPEIIDTLFTNPIVYTSEMVGLAIVILYVARVTFRRRSAILHPPLTYPN